MLSMVRGVRRIKVNVGRKRDPFLIEGILVVLFELIGMLDRQLDIAYLFKSANSSSTSVYPFTDGFLAIFSASNIAAIVSLFG